MLHDSEFNGIDLLGGLAVNFGASTLAAKNGGRVGIKSKKTGQVGAYGDFRFIGGLVAAATAMFVPETVNPSIRRVAFGTANGLLNSYIGTESVRRVDAAQMASGAGTAQTYAPPPQIAQTAPGSEGPALGGNYAYAYGDDDLDGDDW
jgi:hypothetical protein